MDLSSSIRLNSGHKMPRLGLGTWLSKPGEVRAAVEFALRQGYKHVDCASIYFNEKVRGAVVMSGENMTVVVRMLVTGLGTPEWPGRTSS